MPTHPPLPHLLRILSTFALLCGLLSPSPAAHASSAGQAGGPNPDATIGDAGQTPGDTVHGSASPYGDTGPFNKIFPGHESMMIPISVTLSWGISSGANNYEYCLDATNNSTCDGAWTLITNVTSVTLSGLTPNTLYFWQIRSSTSPTGLRTEANGGSWWSFRTAPAPGPFSTLGVSFLEGSPVSAILRWAGGSNATSWEYCITADPTIYGLCIDYKSAASNRVTVTGLAYSTPYYWRVRAIGPGGVTYSDNGQLASFTTWPPPPGAFNKLLPNNNAAGQPTTLLLKWAGSPNADYYNYCVDTSDDGSCDGPWIRGGGDLSGLSQDTTYFWQVVAVNSNPQQTTATDGWWRFTTQYTPYFFNKIAPVNNAIGVPINPTLTWGNSRDAVSYEYCVDATAGSTCDGSWIDAGTSVSVTLSGLSPNTDYYWQLRANRPDGTTYANGLTWYRFTTASLPGAFAKTGPANAATFVSLAPTLSWGSSSDAASYEYCYDTSNDGACNGPWTSSGANRSVTLIGLSPSSTYYWQVRANGPGGVTDADGGAWHRFTTVPLPGAFAKSSPTHTAIGLSLAPTLSWGTSSNATGYAYCYDTVDNDTCDGTWTSNYSGGSVTLSGLSPNTNYYWQVRANGPGGVTDADGGAWYRFTTAAVPGTFGKTNPTHTATGLSLTPTLSWGNSSNTTSYAYCYDTGNNDTCDGNWTSSGTNSSATLSGLAPNTIYYWQVRANGPGGYTYADGGAWYRFTTAPLPGAFAKTSPKNAALDLSVTPTLTWSSSSGATSYEYCYLMSISIACDGPWHSVGSNISVTLSTALYPGQTYQWQVRANTVAGTKYADAGAVYRFTTVPQPGAFTKISPGSGASGLSLAPTLSWQSSSNATSYTYCYDTSNNNTCDGTWLDAGSSVSATLNSLSPSSHYYWQVRAYGPGGTTYADAGTWRSFWTASLPGAFAKTSPTNAATGLTLSPTLSWGSSGYATGYAYCYDTSDNGTCDGLWTSNGMSSSKTLSGLAPSTVYYWQVRANTASGTTDADGGAWYWFTTVPLPGAFGKTSPADSATGLSLTPMLSWGSSSGATSYEYCYDKWDNGTCDGPWTSRGVSTVTLGGLTPDTTYYWLVRANGPGGYTYADAGAWYRFTTAPLPGAFAKTNPPSSATGVSRTPTLIWTSSGNAASYEYCIGPVIPQCSNAWTSVGTSVSITLSALDSSTPYYWQVRANSASGTTYADAGTWRLFTTVPFPGAFAKTDPAYGATGLSVTPTLRWGSSSNFTGYEYCYDTTNNNICDGPWTSSGTDVSVTLSGLTPATTYYWQVLARGPGGTTSANDGIWHRFTTALLPEAFVKFSPMNNATGVSLTPLLNWDSRPATNYVYCYDTTDNGTCDGKWTSVGNTGNVRLTGLAQDTVYYWQVGAISQGGTTYADTGNWYRFTTAPLPGAFAKTGPADAATVSLTPTLTWNGSGSATSYEYCYDTTDNSTCDGTWASIGSKVSVMLSSLSPYKTYYWQVRANSAAGMTYADGGAWYRFTTAPLPAAFAKAFPPNAATGVSLAPTLMWEGNITHTSYEYCFDTSNNNACDGAWTKNAANQSATLNGLAPGATYYWQVRANGPGGTTYADAGAWYRFTAAPVPGAFAKSGPTNAATGLSPTPTLGWGSSSNVTSYDYCYDSSDNSACDGAWTSNGTNRSVTLSGLTPGTTYYWQVRASGPGGMTDADTGVWHRFTTAPLPGAFVKIQPTDGATGLALTSTLSWGSSSNATGYAYCYDTSDNNACDSTWTNNGLNSNVTLSGLVPGVTYYWQVRASGPGGITDADSNTWFRFTTVPLPGAFAKSGPSDAATGLALTPTLSWVSSSGATSFEYCYDTSDNNACNGSWTTASSSVSVTLASLSPGTVYNWQVRANGPGGTTYADAGAWYHFATAPLPGAFAKSGPANNATGITLAPTLSWGSSSGATSFEYCYDTSGNGACDSTWTSSGTAGSGTLSGLTPGTTYYWQVRANGPGGTSYANAGVWYRFTTAPLPGAFAKSGPTNGATGVALAPTLSWGSSSNATDYAVCYDTTDNSSCDGVWTSSGTNRSAALSGLIPGATYYWQARAGTASGTLYADGDTWYRFTTALLPDSFGKMSPADTAVGVSLAPTLIWGSSGGATSYAYCYDTTDNGTCDTTWTGSGTNRSVTLAGLAPDITYYWQVRATSPGGATDADAGVWYGFTTAPQPGAFAKTGPTPGATGLTLTPTLSWGSSSDVTSYTYCYDTSNNSACDGTWLSAGNAVSVTLSSQSPSRTYYWQVRANSLGGTTDADAGVWYGFTTAPQPGAFAKTGPTPGATGLTLTPTLSWGSSSNATSYEVCYDTSNDGVCDGAWTSNGMNTSVTLSGLTPGTLYYWQVRANGPGGVTHANAGAWYRFATIPPLGAFAKIGPVNAAPGLSLTPTLSWGSSSGATSYEYCCDTADNSACDGTWTSTGINRSVTLSGLTPRTVYYWQVRANTAGGTIYANGDPWWSFITPAVLYLPLCLRR